MEKDAQPPPIECDYLVGDDSCRAVKESDMGALRGEACQNEIKDACCYSCNLRQSCEIKCDVLELRRNAKESEETMRSDPVVLDLYMKMECQNCAYYLKPECPRDYSHDTELWRRQDACELFQPIQKVDDRANKNAAK